MPPEEDKMKEEEEEEFVEQDPPGTSRILRVVEPEIKRKFGSLGTVTADEPPNKRPKTMGFNLSASSLTTFSA